MKDGENRKWKKALYATSLALLVLSLGLVNIGAVNLAFQSSQLSIAGGYALDTGVDIGNTTTQMTTMFVTLIGVMIPLIIIMAYLGIFQDFIGGIGNWFRGFKR